jgi:Ras-related protein Rab-1A
MSCNEYLIKICIIGSPDRLKNQFIRKIAGIKDETDSLPPLGVDITTKGIQVDNNTILLIFVYIANFVKARKTWYRGSSGCCILFDKSERKSFLQVNDLYDEYRSINKSPITVVGILGKLQKKITIEPPYFRLVVAEDVTTEEGRELADKLDLTYVETAIDDRKKVEEILHNLAKKVLDSIKALK